VTSRNEDRNFMARGSLSATEIIGRSEPYARGRADVPPPSPIARALLPREEVAYPVREVFGGGRVVVARDDDRVAAVAKHQERRVDA